MATLVVADDDRAIRKIVRDGLTAAGRLRRDIGILRREVETRHRLIVGHSIRMREVVQLAERVTGSDATVFVLPPQGRRAATAPTARSPRGHPPALGALPVSIRP